jgi:phosphoribosylaminoimidazolecarboxamide formyltransferase/IMP cyclohydrolase
MAIGRVAKIDDLVRVRTVLASVSDKTGLEQLVRGLLAANPDLRILSTGGTHAAIQTMLGAAALRSLQQVSAFTGQPEMQDS